MERSLSLADNYLSSNGMLYDIVIVEHTIIMAGVNTTGKVAAHLCVLFGVLQWTAVSQTILS